MNPAKNTIFSKKTLNCKGQLLDISRPIVMGIINVTPDSFYDGGFLKNEKEILLHVEKLLNEGAKILDVGGMSSRPGASFIPEGEEMKRVLPTIASVHSRFPEAIISADTWRSRVAMEAVSHGASMINDISGGAFDPDLWKTIASLKVPYVLMHTKGTPAEMQNNPQYEDVTSEVFEFLKKKVFELNQLNIYDIVLDPGFGFGKTVEHNYQLLKQLEVFSILGLPVMAGLSRKSLICKVLKVNPDKALNGTTVLNTVALINGAVILRVHDVREAMEAIQLTEQLNDGAAL